MLGLARPELPTVVDATGTPLVGRTIDFRLGTQPASPVTSANGVAGAADSGHYLGSVAWATFKLLAK